MRLKDYLFLLALLLTRITVTAQPVVSEIYGGGGISNATYRNDFVELYNPTSSLLALTGWSIQYAAAASASWSAVALSGEIAPHGYFLIQLASGGTNGALLADPDVTGNINMNSSTGGKVALVNGSANLTGICPAGTQIIDLVGYGNAACFSGTAAPSPSAVNSISRISNTGNNQTDFAAGTPSPQSAGRLTQQIMFQPIPSHIYGDPPFELLATSSNDVPVVFSVEDSHIASVESNVVTIKSAGQSTILANLASGYFIANASQSFSIAKAPLTASASSYEIVAGQPIPTLQVSYVGFVNGDDPSDISEPPVATTQATATSPPGVYPITLSAGSDDNYTLTTRNGNLTILHPSSVPDVAVITPANGATGVALNTTLIAKTVKNAKLYTIQLSTASDFATIVQEKTGGRSMSFSQLQYDTRYYVRVKTELSSMFGPVTSFTTGPPSQFTFITSPAQGSTNVNLTTSLTSAIIAGASTYTFELNTSADFSGTSIVASGGRTQKITGLALATTYYVRVRTDLSETWGPTRSFTTGTAATLSYLVAPADKAINISWLPTLIVNSLGADAYTIQLSTSPDFDSGVIERHTANSKVVITEPLAYQTKYYARVSNTLSSGAFGPVRAFTTGHPVGFSFLASPANHAANVNLRPTLTANLVPGATSYTIEVSTDADFGVVTASTSSNRAIPFDLLKDTQYFARVKTNLAEQWGNVRSFTTGNPVTLAYIISPANNATNVNFVTTVNANTIPGANTYTIELNTAPDFTGTSWVQTFSKPSATFTLDQGQTYYARVKTDLSGEWGTQVRSFTTGTATSLAFVSSPKDNAVSIPTTVKLTLNQVGNATSYTVDLCAVPDFSAPVLSQSGKSRVYTFTGLLEDTRYYSRVSTNMAAGQYGPVKSFITATSHPLPGARWVSDPGTDSLDEEIAPGMISGLGFEIFVYPNPFSESVSVMIQSAGEGVGELEVVSDGGKVVYHAFCHPGEVLEMGSEWGSGVYVVRFRMRGYTGVKRLIKIRNTTKY